MIYLYKARKYSKDIWWVVDFLGLVLKTRRLFLLSLLNSVQ